MDTCPECHGTSIQLIHGMNMCLSCGLELGEPFEENIPKLSSIPIDQRFVIYLDKFFGMVGNSKYSGDEIVDKIRNNLKEKNIMGLTVSLTLKDLLREMKELSFQEYYDSAPAIYSILMTGKTMQNHNTTTK